MSSPKRPLLDRRTRSATTLCLGLLPALASATSLVARPHSGLSGSVPGAGGASRPYLAVILAPTLRFAPVPPPPAEMPRLASLEPVVRAAQADPAVSAHPEKAAAPASPEPSSTPDPSGADPSYADPNRLPSAVRILPDDSPRDLRPADFLPFFMFPGSTPPPVPPSSTTYRQR
ncbi:MAG: hypothetical protein FJ382_07590 [Verrucomicrobia bacterium]|nr:hypothetical protein [Verrucomicrobiota bacterium]